MALEQGLQEYYSFLTGIKAMGFSRCSAAFSGFDAAAVETRLAHLVAEEMSSARRMGLAGEGSKGSACPVSYFLQSNKARVF